MIHLIHTLYYKRKWKIWEFCLFGGRPLHQHDVWTSCAELLTIFSKLYFIVHHNLIITHLLGSRAETMLVIQPCYIQTKMYRLYRIMTIFVGILYDGSFFKRQNFREQLMLLYWGSSVHYPTDLKITCFHRNSKYTAQQRLGKAKLLSNLQYWGVLQFWAQVGSGLVVACSKCGKGGMFLFFLWFHWTCFFLILVFLFH